MLWREPLIHFLVLAGLLFALEAIWSERQRERIVVDRRTAEFLIQQREDLELRKLSPEERRETIESWIEDEILYREAYKRGLDKDSRSRRNLILKMRGLALAEMREPTRDELRAYYEASRDRFVRPEGFTIEQVFYPDEGAVPDGILAALRGGADPSQYGEGLFAVGRRETLSSRQLSATLGPDAARAILALPDTDWHGPIDSRHGVHFVRLVERVPGGARALRGPGARDRTGLGDDRVAPRDRARGRACAWRLRGDDRRRSARAVSRLAGLLVVAVLSGFAGSGRAHDIGISQARLVERDGYTYRLAIQSGPNAAHLFQPPELPDHCAISGPPRGSRGTRELSYEFTCDAPLTADHTLELPWSREGAMLVARWRDGSEARGLFEREGAVIEVPLAELRAGSGSLVDAARRYLVLGVEHILIGIDHLLFVVALLLIVRGPWMLVKTITAFTLAHSLTLGLATLGFLDMPSRPVEAAIALSIAFVCAENLHARRGRIGLGVRYPWVVAFAFGLLHGLGFAGALAEIGLPPSEIPVALLFFNVGVEIGQLLFVAALLALAAVGRRLVRDTPTWAGSAAAYGVGVIATYWFLERVAAILTRT